MAPAYLPPFWQRRPWLAALLGKIAAWKRRAEGEEGVVAAAPSDHSPLPPSPPASAVLPTPVPPVPEAATPAAAPAPVTKPEARRRPRAALVRTALPAPPPPPLALPPHASAPLSPERSIAIALQGGGAHGAFTWGVLDRLLDDPHIHFDSVSGTSAGAMNAVVLAYGLISGGRKGAQDLLATFWRRIAEAGRLSPFRRSWLDRLEGGWSMDRSPWLALMDVARQFVSPYQTNPLGLNPLREVLDSLVDFQALRSQDRIRIHVAATDVHSGQPTIFSTRELDCHRVMASACLPHLFQAVEIDGVPYWDGGYLCNPPLMPLVQHSRADDLVVVPINPHCRLGTPRTARDIFNRMNEITFNSSLHQGLETLALLNSLTDRGDLRPGAYRRMRLHVIDADDEFRRLTASSKVNTEWDFLTYLHDVGRAAAERWLAEHRDALGRRDSAALPPPPAWLVQPDPIPLAT